MTGRGPDGRWLPGRSANPNGRPRGAADAMSLEVKEMVRQALDEEGGVEYLRQVARDHPQAFLSLLARLISTELKASIEGVVPMVVVRNYTGVEWEERAENLPESRVVDKDKVH